MKNREVLIPKAHLDYAYLQEETFELTDEFKEEANVRTSMTILIMMETLCNSVWAYTVHKKGVQADPWLPGKLTKDLATAGMAGTRIIVKTDTEPAIVDLRNAIADHRGGAPPVSTTRASGTRTATPRSRG